MALFNAAWFNHLRSGTCRTTLNTPNSRVRHRLGLIFVILPVSAFAIAQSLRFDIPAQPLPTALKAFADQAKIQLLYKHDAVKGATGNAVVGDYDTRDALQMLLKGTGLEVIYSKDDAATIRPMQTAAGRPLRLAQAGPSPARGEDDHQGNVPSSRQGEGAPSVDEGNTEDRENAQSFPRKSELEEIVVTGTHIRGVTISASPTISVQRDDFAKWGASSVQDVMRKMPQNFGGATAHGAAIAANKNGNLENSNYGASINLRGLGSGSTLVLLNGQRIAAAGIGAFVDVSAIPLSALERIDVIPDGASAIYGSDAVGGVVNFVLRDRFEGAESNLRYGGVTDGGLQQFDANQLLGTGWDTGAAFVTLDYQDRTHLEASERGYAHALARGPTHLVPEQRLWSALMNGYQELGEAVRLSATLYANERDVDQTVFNPNSLSQVDSVVETKQAGGTLSLDWRISPTWSAALSHTYSYAETGRDNLLTSVVTGAVQSRTSVLYELDTSVTELIADGPVFAAPGGLARLALGGEHRAETLDATRRGSTQPALRRPVSFERDVDALFAEVNVPLVGVQNARAGLRRLDLIAAVRHEEYSDFGSTTDPKFGVVYSPVTGLDVRGTYGTSFRAPYLAQFDDSFGIPVLFRALDTGLITAAVTQMAGDLGPENASTWTAGFDVRPQALPGLEINATYFRIEYEDRITSGQVTLRPSLNPLVAPRLSMPPDPEVIAAFEYLVARRDPPMPLLIGLPPGTTVNDVQATLDARLLNTAVTNVSGVDLVVSHAFEVAGHRFGAGVNASYLLELENQVFRTSPAVDVVDTIFNPADLRARSFLTWSHGAWSAAGYVNYVDSYRDNQLPADLGRISTWTTFDLTAAYTSQKGLTVRLNATNVFDRAPPTVIWRTASYASPGYDTENADPLGRYVSLMLSLAW